MKVPVRDWTHWAGYGLTRASPKLLARRSDPMAQLLRIDTNPVDNIYPLIEQIRGRGRTASGSVHSFDPLTARWPRLEWIAEILRFADHLAGLEFHDAHHVRRLPVIRHHEFGDP
jgi:hypothetical protein